MRAARAALCALFLLSCARARAQEGAADPFAARPGEKDLSRAERVLSRLNEIRRATASPGGARNIGALHGRYYPGLFVTVAEMRPGELKTELDTAVYLYDLAARARQDDDYPADCERERRDTYGPVCSQLGSPSARELSLAKARLHGRWAEALVAHYRGRGDGRTAQLLAALAEARAHDLLIADEALYACRRLGELLDARGTNYAMNAEGYGRRGDLRGAAEALLAEALSGAASLPRSPIRYRIEAAAWSYRDGLYWASRLERSAARVVSAKDSFLDPLGVLDVRPEAARSTAEANFARARSDTSRAEGILLKARGDAARSRLRD